MVIKFLVKSVCISHEIKLFTENFIDQQIFCPFCPITFSHLSEKVRMSISKIFSSFSVKTVPRKNYEGGEYISPKLQQFVKNIQTCKWFALLLLQLEISKTLLSTK